MVEKNRITREKEWHNESHGDARAPVAKYNAVLQGMKTLFQEKVYSVLDKNTIFLDYGCSRGDRLLDFFQVINKGIGIDISDARIERAKIKAREKNANNLEFFVMDAMNTTFENEKFDVIRGSAILHHLDLALSLNELKRILKNDGYAFFTEPLDTNLLIKFYRKLTPNSRTEDEQPLRRKDLKLVKHIFPNVEIKYFGFFVLLATPFHKKKYFSNILSVLTFFDKIFLGKWSPFKWLAWYCMLIMRK